MNSKFFVIIGVILVIAMAGSIYLTNQDVQNQSKLEQLLEKSQIEFEEIQKSKDVHMYPSKQSELFHVYAYKNQFKENPDGNKTPEILNFILKQELIKKYEDIGLFVEPQNAVVIIPTFTASAYKVPGFYNYYEGKCDIKCLKVIIQDKTSGFTSSDNGVKILSLLQYEMITDVDVDKNPNILKKYDKIILLHNEYVTKNQFDAIIQHPNVIYLYPNALYAEVESNYEENTITLKRGHNFPDKDIKNGFGWEYDNTPMEYDQLCTEWMFYPINNGWMLNCYPEDTLLINNQEFLKQLKEF